MKVMNRDVVNFVNNASGILEKKIPMKLYNAIDLNMKSLMTAAETYMKQYGKCLKKESEEEAGKAVEELLSIEVDAVIQTVPDSVLARVDESDKYDALTGREYQAIRFMISK